MNLSTPEDAHKLLETLGASKRLVTHVILVGEAAEEILSCLSGYGVALDETLVRLGVALHDAGKIIHKTELDGPGNSHEPEGERMLLDAGVDLRIARCCLSHARFEEMECSLEELLVALSDKLWKGKRVESLEMEVTDRVAAYLGKKRWDIFVDLDSCFESVAAGGTERLERSK